jgi:Flp pilus assembly protein TadD
MTQLFTVPDTSTTTLPWMSVTSPQDLLQQAREAHQAGALPIAARLYQRLLEQQPQHAEAYHGLGVVASQSGQHAKAVALLRHAVALRPEVASLHHDLGTALLRQGEVNAAGESYRLALRLQPNNAEAHNSLGNVLHLQGHLAAARLQYQEAIRLQPDCLKAHNNLGLLLKQQGHLAAARAQFDRALQLAPQVAEMHHNLGLVCVAQEDLPAATAAFVAALRLRPRYAEAYNSLGSVLQAQGDLPGALSAYQKALALQPDYADAQWNLALARLPYGDLRQGWPAYEWRWRTIAEPRAFPYPAWDGSTLTNATLLIHAEQGIGDELLFATCFPEVMAKARHVVIECAPRLASLLQRAYPPATVVAGRRLHDDLLWLQQLPSIDVQIATGSLPRYVRATLAQFPPRPGYLVPDAARQAVWRQRLTALGPGMLVGIAWRSRVARRGSSYYTSLEQWGAVLQSPGIHWVNLQYDDSVPELNAAQQRWGITIHTWNDLDLFHDFEGVAALMSCLDLIIAPATTTAVLAASLGQPVWRLSTYNRDWEVLGTDVVPWFPSMRLYRPPQPGDWRQVLARVADDLRHLVT